MEWFTQSLLLGMIITAAMGMMIRLVEPISASTRYILWTCTLVAVAMLPLAGPDKTEAPVAAYRAPVAAALPAMREALPVADPSPSTAVSQAVPRIPSRDYFPALSRPQIFIPYDLPVILLCLYGAIAAMLLTRLWWAYVCMRRLRQASVPAPDELTMRLGRLLAGGRMATIRVSDTIRSPLAIGLNEPVILLPNALLHQLSDAEIDQIAMHEFAHIERYDDWTLLLQRCMEALLFFHPAVRYICRKMDLEREIACDDRVVWTSGASKTYARCLTRLAEITIFRKGPALAPGAAIGKKQIFKRIETLLDGSRLPAPKISWIAMSLVVVVLILMVGRLIRVPALIEFVEHGSRSFNSYRHTDGGHSIEFTTRGDFRFDDDENQVIYLSSDGRIKAEESNGLSLRSMDIQPGPDGTPVAIYRVNGFVHPLDELGRGWFHRVLTDYVRSSGANAEQRVHRILNRRGVAGVLEEIPYIGNDRGARTYMEELLKAGEVNADHRRQVMRLAKRQFRSDYEKWQLIDHTADDYLDEKLLPSIFELAASIGSDHERKRAIELLLDRTGRRKDALVLATDATAAFRSDGDRVAVLHTLLEGMHGDPALLNRFFKQLQSVRSDHDRVQLMESYAARETMTPDALAWMLQSVREMRGDKEKSEILRTLLNHSAGLTPESQVLMLQAVREIRGDREKLEVLRVLVEKYSEEAPVRSEWFEALAQVRSEQGRKEILSQMLRRPTLQEATLAEIIRMTREMRSGKEKLELMNELAARGLPPTLQPSLLEAVQSAGSMQGQQRNLLTYMAEHEPDKEGLLKLIQMADSIPTEKERAMLLVLIAQKNHDPQVREALRTSASRFRSDAEYRRLMSNL